MKHLESIRRLTQLFMSLVCVAFQTAVYGYYWYNYYSLEIKNSISEVSYWNRGNWLIIFLYGVILILFSNLYGGLRIGYLKNLDVFFSQIFATICANVVTYIQCILLAIGFLNYKPFVIMTLIEILGIGIWVFFSSKLYQFIFAPRKLLLIYGSRDIDDILTKFASRKDKYKVEKCVNIDQGYDHIKQEIEGSYDAVVLWDIPTMNRNYLLKYCYSKRKRIYIMPKIPDVIIKGATQLHLFDTPLLLTREYPLSVEQRVMKRLIDIVCSLGLIIITAPIMFVTAIIIKAYDKGPVLYTQNRCTKNNLEFRILKFRSMRVDAEKDGIARLAAQNDDRITPIGKFIRAVRIDELPQLFNIFMGDMSFIGPRPERPEIIAQYLENMPEFAYRTKVKAGLAGYAQVYGKYNTTPYDKLKLDLFYIENYSIILDLKLMLLTLKILLKAESTEGISQEQITALKGKDEEA